MGNCSLPDTGTSRVLSFIYDEHVLFLVWYDSCGYRKNPIRINTLTGHKTSHAQGSVLYGIIIVHSVHKQNRVGS